MKEKEEEKEALRFTICNFLTSNIFGNLALYDFIALHLSSPTLTLTMDMVFFLPSTCSLPPSATGRLEFLSGRFNGNFCHENNTKSISIVIPATNFGGNI